MARSEIVAPEPLIVVEVLSPSTARKDLTVKLAGYFNVPSIEHYVIADWEDCELIHYRREGRGIAPPAILREGVLGLDPPGIAIALADIFR
jgi:Uma2 family endonuclease